MISLLVTRSVWIWNFSLESIQIPRSCISSKSSSTTLCSLYWWLQWIVVLPMCNTLHLIMLKDKSQLLDHWARISISCCSSKQSSGDRIIRYNLISSENNKRGLETKDSNSFTCKANSRGPRTDPWGTPLFTLVQEDNDSLTRTCWYLSIRKHLSHSSKFPSTPYPLSLFNSLLYGTVTKALENQNKWHQ